MSEWLPGFKVLYQRHSAWRWRLGGERHYPAHMIVVPENGTGPLCVFRDQPSAHAWLAQIGDENVRQIVQCAYVPSLRNGVWAGDSFAVLRELPLGTALAEAVCCWE